MRFIGKRPFSGVHGNFIESRRFVIAGTSSPPLERAIGDSACR